MEEPLNDYLYAVDIGTRKVAGLVGRRTSRGAELLDLEVMEHSERSMLDGQVHDVAAVAAVVRRVTHELEKRLGRPIREAAVAAAGRTLKTSAGTARIPISEGFPVGEKDIRDLERSALRAALPGISDGFHCVGYTPVACRLDGVPLRSLLDQRGRSAEMDVLATFLPRPVLDGLLSVCRQAGLGVSCITLEPIAALEAVIPPDLRLLNLALVDVGAGTSDIAVVKGGQVTAFAMVPMAGDEITEALCHHWVLDFQRAESLKRALSSPGDVPCECEDIFGNRIVVPVPEAQRSIQGALREMSRAVADRILEINHGSPAAVVLVGGGSATAGLAEQIGVDLNLENRRIGVRRPTQALNLEDRTGRLTEAWGVTPAGILLVAAADRGLRVFGVLVNGVEHPVLQVGERVVLGDLLEASGLPVPGGRVPRGKDLRFTLNGMLRCVEGSPGRAAAYRLGGREIAVEDPLPPGASITFEPSLPGADARALAGDLSREVPETAIFLNGLPVVVRARVRVDSRSVPDEEPIPEGARVEVDRPDTLREILEDQGFEIGGEVSRQILVSIDGQPTYLTQRNYRLTVGGVESDFDRRVRQGDVVEFARDVQAQYRVRDVVAPPPDGASIRLVVNGHPFILPGEPGRVFMNGQPVSPDEFLIDHATLITRPGRPATGLVSHVLAQMERPRASRPGQRLNLTVDGLPAGFTTEVREGSRVVIAFE
jgi:cell division protein FtsA